MKAGTATKLVLNMITTGAMIRLGKTFGNLMVDLRATNDKLKDRSERILMEVCEVDRERRARTARRCGRRREDGDRHALPADVSRADAERALERGGWRDPPRRRAPPPPVSRHSAVSVYVGLMSGTSLDGISAAVVALHSRRRERQPHRAAAARVSRSSPYTPAQRARLRSGARARIGARYCRLAFDLGDWLADAAIGALADAGVPRAEVRAIGSHGQTLWHEPAALDLAARRSRRDRRADRASPS